MKKLLSLLFIFSISQINAQSSLATIDFDNYETSKYSSMKISFGGKYNSKLWKFTKGSQIIYFTPNDLETAAKVFEEAINKALEWDKIADENNVEELTKEMQYSFSTTKGMLEDSGYEIVGPKKSEFEFERFTSNGKAKSYMKTSIWQNGDYNVRSAFFKFPSLNVKDKKSMESFYKFLDFMKNNKSIINEKLKDSKEDLFKN